MNPHDPYFANLKCIDVGRVNYMQKKYVIWNPEFVNESLIKSGMLQSAPSAYTIEGLAVAEEISGGSLSSVIVTHDVEGLISLIAAQTKSSLLYSEISGDAEKIDVVVFSLDLYRSYQDAKDNGAVTSLSPVYASDLELVASTFHMTQENLEGNGRAIGTLANGVFTEI